jgi:hypothetical protein
VTPARARTALNQAVKRGEVVRPRVCSRCERAGRIVGHHVDYDRPLDVVWLCLSCHRAEHERLGWGAPHNGPHEKAITTMEACRIRFDDASFARFERARAMAERREGGHLPAGAFARRLMLLALASASDAE